MRDACQPQLAVRAIGEARISVVASNQRRRNCAPTVAADPRAKGGGVLRPGTALAPAGIREAFRNPSAIGRRYRVSILPRGLALGATQQAAQEDRHLVTRAELRAKLAVLMGGTASERPDLEAVLAAVPAGERPGIAAAPRRISAG